jgi:hypothetical protein
MSDVTIKLSGSDYRLLCLELEWHAQTLKDGVKAISGGQPKQTAAERLARFEAVRERVTA